MKHFYIICGLNTYKFHVCFYFWAMDIVGEYILSVNKNEDGEIILVVGDEIASDIPFFRQRCGYGLYR